MFGLIAEDVEKVDADLVTRNDKGEVETVRYEAVNAMVLNEFLKQHRTVQEQKATIAQLESTVAQQQKDFQATIARLTTASTSHGKFEVNKQASQMISSSH